MPPVKERHKHKGKASEQASLGHRASVKALWEVLQACGDGFYTVRGLARATGFSVGQVHRALKILAAQGLITWERAPKLGSKITIPGRAASERNVHPRTPSSKNIYGHTGQRPAVDAQLGTRALPWALAQVRNDLRGRPSISPARRGVIMASLGPAVHRAVTRGHVRTRRELDHLVSFILARIDERRGLGHDYPETRRWAEWCVREALRALEEDREREAKNRAFLEELRREGEEARRAWQDPDTRAQIALPLAPVLKTRQPKPLGEAVPDLEERRRRYLALLEGQTEGRADLLFDESEPQERC